MGEIEKAIDTIEFIDQSIVQVMDNQLVAYIVPKHSQDEKLNFKQQRLAIKSQVDAKTIPVDNNISDNMISDFFARKSYREFLGAVPIHQMELESIIKSSIEHTQSDKNTLEYSIDDINILLGNILKPLQAYNEDELL